MIRQTARIRKTRKKPRRRNQQLLTLPKSSSSSSPTLLTSSPTLLTSSPTLLTSPPTLLTSPPTFQLSDPIIQNHQHHYSSNAMYDGDKLIVNSQTNNMPVQHREYSKDELQRMSEMTFPSIKNPYSNPASLKKESLGEFMINNLLNGRRPRGLLTLRKQKQLNSPSSSSSSSAQQLRPRNVQAMYKIDSVIPSLQELGLCEGNGKDTKIVLDSPNIDLNYRNNPNEDILDDSTNDAQLDMIYPNVISPMNTENEADEVNGDNTEYVNPLLMNKTNLIRKQKPIVIDIPTLRSELRKTINNNNNRQALRGKNKTKKRMNKPV